MNSNINLNISEYPYVEYSEKLLNKCDGLSNLIIGKMINDYTIKYNAICIEDFSYSINDLSLLYFLINLNYLFGTKISICPDKKYFFKNIKLRIINKKIKIISKEKLNKIGKIHIVNSDLLAQNLNISDTELYEKISKSPFYLLDKYFILSIILFNKKLKAFISKEQVIEYLNKAETNNLWKGIVKLNVN